MTETLPTFKVFGQNNITSLATYLEQVRPTRDKGLQIMVAGPSYYDNEMFIEGYEKEELLKAFQPPSFVDRNTGKTIQYGSHMEVSTVEDLEGHSITAFYQDAKLIGFQRRG